MPRPSADEKRDLLARIPLFAQLAPRELVTLAGVARSQSLRPREELFHKGDACTQVFAIVRGTLKALTTSDEGDDVVFTLMGPGELVGEISFFADGPRTATVTAVTESDLLVIDRREFAAFLRSHPEAALRLMKVLAERVKRVSEFVEDTLFLNLPVRLAKKVLHYASIYGREAENGVRVDVKLSQEEWGDLVGATRESINKQLRAWTDEGVIRLDHGYVVIERRDALERLAGFDVV